MCGGHVYAPKRSRYPVNAVEPELHVPRTKIVCIVFPKRRIRDIVAGTARRSIWQLGVRFGILSVKGFRSPREWLRGEIGSRAKSTNGEASHRTGDTFCRRRAGQRSCKAVFARPETIPEQ